MLCEAFPQHLKSLATHELADRLNSVSSDPEQARVFRDSMVSYASVLGEGRFRVEDYVNAVIYVSHKMMGCSNQSAWKKTFPQRYAVLIAKAAGEQDISAYVAAFNRNKLVNLVLEQSLGILSSRPGGLPEGVISGIGSLPVNQNLSLLPWFKAGQGDLRNPSSSRSPRRE